ncbi:MAG: hypothetical protein LKJ48_07335 [Lactobacillus sp.]|jgi:hypothetical protein|nr:hypothetical protein [Lactobacillus sp.]
MSKPKAVLIFIVRQLITRMRAITNNWGFPLLSYNETEKYLEKSAYFLPCKLAVKRVR